MDLITKLPLGKNGKLCKAIDFDKALANNLWTYQEIADVVGLSRERVRQYAVKQSFDILEAREDMISQREWLAAKEQARNALLLILEKNLVAYTHDGVKTNCYISPKGEAFMYKDGEMVPKKLNYDFNGYARVTITVDKGHYISQYIHRMVALTFIPVPEEVIRRSLEQGSHITVDHINHDKTNNTVSNLQWLTQVDNSAKKPDDFSLAQTEYIIVNLETGNETIIKNLMGYCKNNDLSYGCMQQILRGQQHSHKGLFVKKLEKC